MILNQPIMGQTSHLVEIQTMNCEIENSSQISEENICKTTVLNLLQKLDQYIYIYIYIYIEGMDEYFTLLNI